MSEQNPPSGSSPVHTGPEGPTTRVCAKCSVQTQTYGDFCPHCGNSYITHRRRIDRKVLVAAIAATVLLAAAGAGITLKVQHDREQEREAAAAAAEAEAEAEADAEAEAEQAALDAQLEAEQAERDVRASLIKQMQQSITKDAKEKVEEGILEGPIFHTSCDPLGGGSVDDLTALTTTFECLAVNEKMGGGQVRGWVFSATMNWDEAGWSWQLGD